MQPTRNIRLIISLAGLLIAVAIVYFLQRDQVKVIVDPGLFRVTDATTINRVRLESSNGDIDLRYDGRTWKINGKYEADGQLIKVLMATLLQVTPRHPVALQQKDSIDQRLSRDGTKVSVFSADGLEKEFRAGGNAGKTQAYFRDIKSGETCLMTIPGYRVYASGVFELKENDWREKRVFNFNWRNFRQLLFTWRKDPAASFEFVKQKDFLGIVGMENPDSTRVNNFLNDVLTLSADQIIAPGSNKTYDSLTKTNPIIQITVTDILKHNYMLELFSQEANQASIIGKAWGGEIVVFDRRKLFTVTKKRPYFREDKVRP